MVPVGCAMQRRRSARRERVLQPHPRRFTGAPRAGEAHAVSEPMIRVTSQPRSKLARPCDRSSGTGEDAGPGLLQSRSASLRSASVLGLSLLLAACGSDDDAGWRSEPHVDLDGNLDGNEVDLSVDGAAAADLARSF